MIPLALGLIGKVAAAAVLPRVVKAVCDLVRRAENHRDSARERCTGETSIRNNPMVRADPSGLVPPYWGGAVVPSFPNGLEIGAGLIHLFISPRTVDGGGEYKQLVKKALKIVDRYDGAGDECDPGKIHFVRQGRDSFAAKTFNPTGEVYLNLDFLDSRPKSERLYELVSSLANETCHVRNPDTLGHKAELESAKLAVDVMNRWAEELLGPDFASSDSPHPIYNARNRVLNLYWHFGGK